MKILFSKKFPIFSFKFDDFPQKFLFLNNETYGDTGGKQSPPKGCPVKLKKVDVRNLDSLGKND